MPRAEKSFKNTFRLPQILDSGPALGGPFFTKLLDDATKLRPPHVTIRTVLGVLLVG